MKSRCLAFSLLLATGLSAQPPQGFRGPGSELVRKGAQLDLQGKGAEARAVFQEAIDKSSTPAAKANAERAMAMSWAFEGNCGKTVEYESKVIGYWKTQEAAAPDRAFYQQGEMADEAARVCLDNGDLNTAYRLYKQGHDLGLKEPGISPARKDLWNYRWQHAQARISARRGNKASSEKHVAAAKAILDNMKQKDARLYEQQKAFFPYLTGYVALYTGNYKVALGNLEKANRNDPFIQCLMGMAYEKLGDKSKAMEEYRKAAASRRHNPPGAFAHHFTAAKLAQS